MRRSTFCGTPRYLLSSIQTPSVRSSRQLSMSVSRPGSGGSDSDLYFWRALINASQNLCALLAGLGKSLVITLETLLEAAVKHKYNRTCLCAQLLQPNLFTAGIRCLVWAWSRLASKHARTVSKYQVFRSSASSGKANSATFSRNLSRASNPCSSPRIVVYLTARLDDQQKVSWVLEIDNGTLTFDYSA